MKRVLALLDAARDVCGSDASLARRLKCDPSHPAQWRSGKRPITARTVGLLSDVVGLDATDATRLALVAVVESEKDPDVAAILRKVFGFFRVLGALRRRPHPEPSRRIDDRHADRPSV